MPGEGNQAPMATAPTNPTRPRRLPHEAEAPRTAAPLDVVDVEVADVLRVLITREVMESEVVVVEMTTPVELAVPVAVVVVDVLFLVKLAVLECVVLVWTLVEPVLTLTEMEDECGFAKMGNEVLLASTLFTLSTATKATK